MVGSVEPIICQFYRLIPGAPEPRRADRSAEGTLPVNAYRYCEAIASASSFGWYLYPPLSFSLWWDGPEIGGTMEAPVGWYALGGAKYPGFGRPSEKFGPDALEDPAPQFLVRGMLRGVVRI